MRWIVEVSPLRPSLAPGDVVPPDTYVVEAKSWQQALQTARDFAGSTGPISQISIELLPEGYRAIDPVGRMRYVIKRAPEEAAVTSPGRYSVRDPALDPLSGPSTEVQAQRPRSVPPSAPRSQPPPAPRSHPPPAPRSNPPGTTPASTRVPKAATMALENASAPTGAVANLRTAVTPSAIPVPGVGKVSTADFGVPRPDSGETRSPVAQSIASPPIASVPATSRIPSTVPSAPSVSHKVDLNSTQKSAAMVEALPPHEIMVSREEEPSAKSPITYREYAYVVPQGTPDKAVERLIRSCFHDVLGRLRSAPAGKLVNLAVFDVAFTGKPPRPPLATLAWKDWRGPEPEIRFPARERALAAAASAPASIPAAAPAPAQRAAPEPVVEAPPQKPAAPVATNGAGHAPIEEIDVEMDPTPAQPPPAPVAAPPADVAPAFPPPTASPPVAVAASPAPIAEPAPAPMAPPAPVAAAAPVAPPPAPVAAPAPADAAAAGFDPFATGKKKSTPSIRVATGARLSGEDLLGDLFEAMHDLHFMPSTLEGAHFVLSLAMEKLPSRVAICHLFDINRREFVVVHAIAKTRDALVLTRIPEKDPLASQTLNRRRAIVILDAANDPRVKGARYDALGTPVVSLVTAPVALGGRFLGMLELVNPADGGTFVEGDGYALSYMGEQFAEFLGQRGVLIEPDVIKAFKPH